MAEGGKVCLAALACIVGCAVAQNWYVRKTNLCFSQSGWLPVAAVTVGADPHILKYSCSNHNNIVDKKTPTPALYAFALSWYPSWAENSQSVATRRRGSGRLGRQPCWVSLLDRLARTPTIFAVKSRLCWRAALSVIRTDRPTCHYAQSRLAKVALVIS